VTDEELKEQAEVVIYSLLNGDPFLGLVENGMSEDDADKVCRLVNRAIISISWPDDD